MLKCYIDDSGSGGDSKWFVLAGYVGTVAGWDRFDEAWRNALDDHPRIDYFKSSEAERLRDQFCGFTEQQRDAKIDALIEVIGSCADRALSGRMRQRDYNEIAKGQIPERYDSPYYLLFPTIIAAAVGMERIEGKGEPIEFVFDTDQRFERLKYEMVTKLRPLRSFSGLLNVSYCDDKEALPLQAADLLAWQIRRAFSKTDEPRRRHWDAALGCPPMKPHTFVFTREKLVDMIGELKNEVAEFCAKNGKRFEVRDL